jgi:hypothetical protein
MLSTIADVLLFPREEPRMLPPIRWIVETALGVSCRWTRGRPIRVVLLTHSPEDLHNFQLSVVTEQKGPSGARVDNRPRSAASAAGIAYPNSTAKRDETSSVLQKFKSAIPTSLHPDWKYPGLWRTESRPDDRPWRSETEAHLRHPNSLKSDSEARIVF